MIPAKSEEVNSKVVQFPRRNLERAEKSSEIIFKDSFIIPEETYNSIKSTVTTYNKKIDQFYDNTPNKGSDLMDWQEKYIDQLNENMKEIKTELKEIRKDISANRKETQSEMQAIRSDIQNTNRWIMGLVVAAGLSFLGIAISLSFGMYNVINIIRSLVLK